MQQSSWGKYLSTLVTWSFPICQSNARKLPDQLLPTPPASTCLGCHRGWRGRYTHMAKREGKSHHWIGSKATNRWLPKPRTLDLDCSLRD